MIFGTVVAVCLVAFYLWARGQGKLIAKSENLAKSLDKTRKYITAKDIIEQKARVYDEQIHQEYMRGPGADNLNRMLKDLDGGGAKTSKTNHANKGGN